MNLEDTRKWQALTKKALLLAEEFGRSFKYPQRMNQINDELEKINLSLKKLLKKNGNKK